MGDGVNYYIYSTILCIDKMPIQMAQCRSVDMFSSHTHKHIAFIDFNYKC